MSYKLDTSKLQTLEDVISFIQVIFAQMDDNTINILSQTNPEMSEYFIEDV